jgi:DNA gyrase/topoisomerase IV subunit A
MAASEAPDRQAAVAEACVLLLDTDGGLRIARLDAARLEEEEPFEVEDAPNGAAPRPRQVVIVRPDEPLLMLTTRYRFVLTTAAHLLDMQELGLQAGAYYQLRPDEIFTSLSRWQSVKVGEKLLLATNKGFVRAYPMAGLVEAIESPTAFQFDQPLPGVPVSALGMGLEDQLVMALDNGRAVRFPLAAIPTLGMAAINRRNGERVVAAFACMEQDELLLLAADGYARRLVAEWIPVPPRPNAPGKALISSRTAAGLIPAPDEGLAWAYGDGRLVPVPAHHLDADFPQSTRSYRLLKLPAGAEVGPIVSP